MDSGIVEDKDMVFVRILLFDDGHCSRDLLDNILRCKPAIPLLSRSENHSGIPGSNEIDGEWVAPAT